MDPKLFLAALIGGLVFVFRRQSFSGSGSLGSLTYDLNKGQVIISNGQDSKFIVSTAVNENYASCEEKTDREQCFTWENKVQLSLREQPSTDDVRCYTVAWKPIVIEYTPEDCISMADGHWYGGTEMLIQHWPSDKQSARMQPYISSDILSDRSEAGLLYGSVIERYWVNSQGFGISIDASVPLHVSFNYQGDKKLCLKADKSHPRYAFTNVQSGLNYTVCAGLNVKHVHRYMSKIYLGKPNGLPDARMFKYPVWSTWARYKIDITQVKVLEYAQEILQYGFPNSQVEIDDMYSSYYGEIDFAAAKFPDPKKMIEELHSKGFRVTSWVHPFVNVDAPSFLEGMRRGYFVSAMDTRVPALVKWWQGIGALIDVTNPEAAKWYRGRLEQLRTDTGLDSYKFDAGEVVYLPMLSKTKTPLANPGEFSTVYADFVSSLGDLVELRVATQSQQHPVFVRMFDKDSTWGYNNGLKTMIPTALLMGLLGYPYVLPDMIGGNAYGETDFLETQLPEKELFIRWMQLSAFLPSMQFSIAPWQYDNETVTVAKEMVAIHANIVTPVIIKAARESIIDGTPIIRPLWWINPSDETALNMDSEFLVGDEILVAPILEQGSRSRDVYFPEGQWKDAAGNQYQGPGWTKGFQAKLADIPYFFKA